MQHKHASVCSTFPTLCTFILPSADAKVTRVYSPAFTCVTDMRSNSPTFYAQRFTLKDPKSVNRHWSLDCLFALLRSECVKAVHKTLLKLTHGVMKKVNRLADPRTTIIWMPRIGPFLHTTIWGLIYFFFRPFLRIFSDNVSEFKSNLYYLHFKLDPILLTLICNTLNV